MKYDQLSRLEIAKSIWRLFIADIVRAKIHYGKRHIFVVIELKEDADSESITEAHITDMDRYAELKSIPMSRDGS